MVIDVDDVVLVESAEFGAGNAVALENDGRFRIRRLPDVAEDRIGVRQRTVNPGNTVAQHNLRLLAHAAQDLAASQRRSDGVTVWPRM